MVFKPVDEAKARVEFCLAWSRHSECAVIGRFLTSMRESATLRSVQATAIRGKPS